MTSLEAPSSVSVGGFMPIEDSSPVPQLTANQQCLTYADYVAAVERDLRVSIPVEQQLTLKYQKAIMAALPPGVDLVGQRQGRLIFRAPQGTSGYDYAVTTLEHCLGTPVESPTYPCTYDNSRDNELHHSYFLSSTYTDKAGLAKVLKAAGRLKGIYLELSHPVTDPVFDRAKVVADVSAFALGWHTGLDDSRLRLVDQNAMWRQYCLEGAEDERLVTSWDYIARCTEIYGFYTPEQANTLSSGWGRPIEKVTSGERAVHAKHLYARIKLTPDVDPSSEFVEISDRLAFCALSAWCDV